MSFKPSVSTDGGATFDENNLAFATREEAETSATRSHDFSNMASSL